MVQKSDLFAFEIITNQHFRKAWKIETAPNAFRSKLPFIHPFVQRLSLHFNRPQRGCVGVYHYGIGIHISNVISDDFMHFVYG